MFIKQTFSDISLVFGIANSNTVDLTYKSQYNWTIPNYQCILYKNSWRNFWYNTKTMINIGNKMIELQEVCNINTEDTMSTRKARTRTKLKIINWSNIERGRQIEWPLVALTAERKRLLRRPSGDLSPPSLAKAGR